MVKTRLRCGKTLHFRDSEDWFFGLRAEFAHRGRMFRVDVNYRHALDETPTVALKEKVPCEGWDTFAETTTISGLDHARDAVDRWLEAMDAA